MDQGFYTSKDFLPLVAMASKPGVWYFASVVNIFSKLSAAPEVSKCTGDYTASHPAT